MVQAPLLPVIPSAELIGPSSIARCDNVTIASIITNSGGKPLSYYWTVTANGAATSTALATYVSKVNTKVRLIKHALSLTPLSPVNVEGKMGPCACVHGADSAWPCPCRLRR